MQNLRIGCLARSLPQCGHGCGTGSGVASAAACRVGRFVPQLKQKRAFTIFELSLPHRGQIGSRCCTASTARATAEVISRTPCRPRRMVPQLKQKRAFFIFELSLPHRGHIGSRSWPDGAVLVTAGASWSVFSGAVLAATGFWSNRSSASSFLVTSGNGFVSPQKWQVTWSSCNAMPHSRHCRFPSSFFSLVFVHPYHEMVPLGSGTSAAQSTIRIIKTTMRPISVMLVKSRHFIEIVPRFS